MSHAGEAAPFDRAAVEALLAEATAWPVAKVGGGLPIEISHYPVEAVAPSERRPFALQEAGKWAGVVTLGLFAIGAGLHALSERRATPEITVEAPGLYALRPQPVIEDVEPVVVASAQPAPPMRPVPAVRRPPRPPRAEARDEARDEAIAPLPEIASPPDTEVDAPVLAMATEPRMPAVLVVRRQSGADVLGAAAIPRRVADDSDGAGLRSVEPERMAMSVDVRTAERP